MSNKNYGGLEPNVATSPVDLYKDACFRINEIFKYDDQFKATFGGATDNLKATFYLIQRDLDKAILDQRTQITNDEVKTVFRTVDILTEKFVFSPIDGMTKDFTFYIIKLINNWNNSCLKNQELERKLIYLDRLFKSQITMLETIEIFRLLLDRIKPLLTYTPPAFELSRAYKETLSNVVEKDDKA